MSATHDSDYKLLFSHPEMVRDLLRDWAPGEWIKEADFSTLEHVNGATLAKTRNSVTTTWCGCDVKSLE
jgi:hypothetical protein